MKNRGLLIWIAVICVGCGVTMWLADTSTAVHAQAAQTQATPEPATQQQPAADQRVNDEENNNERQHRGAAATGCLGV